MMNKRKRMLLYDLVTRYICATKIVPIAASIKHVLRQTERDLHCQDMVT